MLTHKELKARALERADVKAEYDRLAEEFEDPNYWPNLKQLEKKSNGAENGE